MRKIDGHAHLVRAISGFNGKGRLTPLGTGKAIWDDGELLQLIPKGYGEESFTAEAFIRLMSENDVEKAVILQGSLNGYQNYYTYQAIKKYPERFIGAFSVDIFAENYFEIVKRYVEDLGFRAIKLEISQGGGMHGYHGNTPFRLDTDSRVGKILHYLSEYPGFVMTVDYGNWDQISYQPEAMAILAKRYNNLDFVICHLSFPHADSPNRLKSALSQWVGLSNLYTDLSAIQDIDRPDKFPFPKCQKSVRLAKEILGASQLIWGTDAPWSATFNTYKELATWLENTDIFTEEELEQVMGGNAAKVYFKDSAVQAIRRSEDPVVKELDTI